MNTYRHYETDRDDNVLATGLWPGTGKPPIERDKVLLTCHACGTKQITPVQDVLQSEDGWTIQKERLANGEWRIWSVPHRRPLFVLATCLSCKASLAVHVIGWTLEPWTFGCGIIKPMSSAWVEVEDDEEDAR